MPNPTLEERFRIIENREYLDVTIRAFLFRESLEAQAAHDAYLREVGIRPQ